MEFLFGNQLASGEAILVLLCLLGVGVIFLYDGYLYIARIIGILSPRKEYIKEKQSEQSVVDEKAPITLEEIEEVIEKQNEETSELPEETKEETTEVPNTSDLSSEDITHSPESESPLTTLNDVHEDLQEDTLHTETSEDKAEPLIIDRDDDIQSEASEVIQGSSPLDDVDTGSADEVETFEDAQESVMEDERGEITIEDPDLVASEQDGGEKEDEAYIGETVSLEDSEIESTPISTEISEDIQTGLDESLQDIPENPQIEENITGDANSDTELMIIEDQADAVMDAPISTEEDQEGTESIQSEPIVVPTKPNAQKLPPISPEKRERLIDITNTVRTFIARGHIVEARALIIEGLSIQKYHRELNIMLGELYERDHAFEKAEYIYKDLIQYFPEDSEIIMHLANTLAMQHKYRVSYEFYKKILEIQGESEEILYTLSHLASELGETEDTYEYARLYTKQYPKNPEILWLLSQSQITLGKRKDAIETLIKLKNLTPYSQEIVDLIGKLVTEEEMAGNFGTEK